MTTVGSIVWVSTDMLKSAARYAPCITHVGLGFSLSKIAMPSIT